MPTRRDFLVAALNNLEIFPIHEQLAQIGLPYEPGKHLIYIFLCHTQCIITIFFLFFTSIYTSNPSCKIFPRMPFVGKIRFPAF